MAVFNNYEHTFAQNLNIIKSTGVYGVDIRKSIAEAIDQADGAADSRISEIRHDQSYTKHLRKRGYLQYGQHY